MVFFSCNSCGESVKKYSVEKHTFKCVSCITEGLSCMDCSQKFSVTTYECHTKCAEAEKFGGPNFVSKERKGTIQQEKLFNNLTRIMEDSTDLKPDVKNELNWMIQIMGPNFPQTKQKFENLVKSNWNLDPNLREEIWTIIENGWEVETPNGVADQTTPSKGKDAPAPKSMDLPQNKKKKIKKGEDEEVDNKQTKRKSVGSEETGETTIDSFASKSGEGEKIKKKKKRKSDIVEVNGDTTNETMTPRKKKSKKGEEESINDDDKERKGKSVEEATTDTPTQVKKKKNKKREEEKVSADDDDKQVKKRKLDGVRENGEMISEALTPKRKKKKKEKKKKEEKNAEEKKKDKKKKEEKNVEETEVDKQVKRESEGNEETTIDAVTSAKKKRKSKSGEKRRITEDDKQVKRASEGSEESTINTVTSAKKKRKSKRGEERRITEDDKQMKESEGSEETTINTVTPTKKKMKKGEAQKVDDDKQVERKLADDEKKEAALDTPTQAKKKKNKKREEDNISVDDDDKQVKRKSGGVEENGETTCEALKRKQLIDEDVTARIENGVDGSPVSLQNGHWSPEETAHAQFKWKSSIRKAISESPEGRIKLKKLEKRLVEEYMSVEGADEEQGRQVFRQKMDNDKFVMQDKYVRLK